MGSAPVLNAATVTSVGSYLPPKIVSNDDLSKLMDTNDQWIRERTGIETRRIADPSLGTSDLAVLAAKDALEKANLRSEDLDLILAATLSPDYFFPGIGVLVQDKLGAPLIPALDIRGQCSGFAWCMATADSFIRSGAYKRILIVGAEIHSKVLEFSNRGRDVSVLFGDGAGAMILTSEPCKTLPTAQNQTRGIIDSLMGCDGSGAKYLLMDRPGFGANHAEFLTEKELEEKAYLPKMEGKFVFKNAVSRMTAAAETLLKRNNLTPHDLNLIIPHQANLRINELVRERLELPTEKVFNNIQKYGNTTAATLPLVMCDAEKSGKLKPGDLVMTLAFGSGFTWAANLLRW